eukprot:433774_1
MDAKILEQIKKAYQQTYHVDVNEIVYDKKSGAIQVINNHSYTDPSESFKGYKVHKYACGRSSYINSYLSQWLNNKFVPQRIRCHCIHCAIEYLIQTQFLHKIERYLQVGNVPTGYNTDIGFWVLSKIFISFKHFLAQFSLSKVLFQRFMYILWWNIRQCDGTMELYGNLSEIGDSSQMMQFQRLEYYQMLSRFMIICNKPKHMRWFLEMANYEQILEYYLNRGDEFRGKCHRNKVTKMYDGCDIHGSVDRLSFRLMKALKQKKHDPLFKTFITTQHVLYNRLRLLYKDMFKGQQGRMERKRAFGVYRKRLLFENNKKAIDCGNPKCNHTYFEWKYECEYYDCIWNNTVIHKWYLCKGCSMYYCSRKCQKYGWIRFNHKAQCQKVQKLRLLYIDDY